MGYTDDLDEFERDLLRLAGSFEGGKHTKNFLRREATRLNRESKKVAKFMGVKKKKGDFIKGFKRTKVRKGKKQFSISAINDSPHAHLLNNGHIQTDKYGNELGFVEGFFYMEKAKENFEEGHHDAVQDFIEDLIDKHGM